MATKIYVESGAHHWVPPELRAKSIDTAGVIAEQRIRWPAGVGHCDAFIPETRTVVEVLSSAHASEEMRHSKLLQAVIYTEHHPQAENCALVIVSPTDFTTERVVLMPKSRQYKELVAEMRERLGQVARWEATGELPPRVCRKRSDSWGHFCLFADHCFDDYEPPMLGTVEVEEARELAARWVELKRRGAASVEQKEAEAERKLVEAQLAEIVPVGEFQVGPYRVSRTHVDRKPTFLWERAEMAGLFEPGLYGEFMKPGASYSIFKVEQTGSDTSELPDEFGTEAPF
jgi:hypothetical protein